MQELRGTHMTHRGTSGLFANGSSGGRRRGSALVVALLAVISVSVMGAGFLRFTSSIMRRQEQSIDTKQAFYMAEAGLAEAWAAVLLGKTGVVGSEKAPAKMGNGLFWVERTVNPDGTVTLESTGLYGSGRATLQVAVGWSDTAASENAITTDEPLVIPDGALIDGYDPDAGPDPETSPTVQLRSNGSITVEGTVLHPAEVDGDLMPGPGETATVDPDSTLSGTIYESSEPITLDPVSVPDVALGSGVVHSDTVPYAVPMGTVGFDHLEIAGSSQAIITGPATVVIGRLEVAPRGELVLDATLGKIEIYVTEELRLQRGATVTTVEDDSTQVSVEVDGDVPVDLNGISEFHGVLYAPEAAVYVGPGFQLYGSVAARRLDLAPGVQLHFDQRVRNEAQRSLLPHFIGWRVESIPEAIRTNLGHDPAVALGVDPDALRPPYTAHKDQSIRVVYLDLSLTLQTFMGRESGFDWNNVAVVKEITRDGSRTACSVSHDGISFKISL